MLQSFFPILLIDTQLERDRFMLIRPYISSLMIFFQITLECLTPFSINLILWHVARLKYLGNFSYLKRTPWEIINQLSKFTGCMDGLNYNLT